MKDYSNNRDYATYLPAISGFYTKQMGSIKNLEPDRLPNTFEYGPEGIDFLKKENSYFNYGAALYSAGHATLDLEKAREKEPMIHDRDRNNITLVGDSGGYQIGRGVLKFDWENFYEKEGDAGYVGDADKTRHLILEWLDNTCDWSMTLDVPPWLVSNPEIAEKIGMKTEEDCLKASLFNLDFFMKYKTGKTNWLNVLQGTTREFSDKWYEAVKDYDCQGWAMGGTNIQSLELLLHRIIKLRDDGLLKDKNWIHCLGVGRPDIGIMLTSIQRQIRKHVNPNLTISFDSSTPFLAVANAQIISQNIFNGKQFKYDLVVAPDNKDFYKSTLPFPYPKTEIGKRMTLGDICKYDYGMTNKQGKEPKTSWDTFSYMLLMAHNVESLLQCIQEGNMIFDVIKEQHEVDWRNWRKKPLRAANTISPLVPDDLLYFNSLVEELFVSDNPEDLIIDAREMLSSLDRKTTDVSPKKSQINELFD